MGSITGIVEFGDIAYRYESLLWTNDKAQLYCNEYKVIKHTDCGVWIERSYGESKKFILTAARKQWASPTKELALEAFRARKRRQIRILKHQLLHAEAALNADPEKDDFFYLD